MHYQNRSHCSKSLSINRTFQDLRNLRNPVGDKKVRFSLKGPARPKISHLELQLVFVV